MLTNVSVSSGQDHKDIDRLATKPEIADFLRITERTVEKHMKNGVIPFLKLGSGRVLFNRADILAALSKK